MNLNKKVILSKNIKTRKTGPNILIFSPEDDLFFELNESAGVILDLIDGVKTGSDIVKHLANEYDEKEEVIQKDVVALFERLKKLKVINFDK